MENSDFRQPDQKVEMIDLADTTTMLISRPKPTRGRPPGSVSRKKAVTDLENNRAERNDRLSTTNGASSNRINGRPTKITRSERATPSRLHSDKPIFTLSVAADILALHPRTLRIYEEHALVVPYRTQTQRRRYSQNDIKKFQFIQFLTQRRRVNLEGVKIILSMLDELNHLGISDPVKHIFTDYQEVD